MESGLGNPPKESVTHTFLSLMSADFNNAFINMVAPPRRTPGSIKSPGKLFLIISLKQYSMFSSLLRPIVVSAYRGQSRPSILSDKV